MNRSFRKNGPDLWFILTCFTSDILTCQENSKSEELVLTAGLQCCHQELSRLVSHVVCGDGGTGEGGELKREGGGSAEGLVCFLTAEQENKCYQMKCEEEALVSSSVCDGPFLTAARVFGGG